jgi:ADP-ribosylglycohydrolase
MRKPFQDCYWVEPGKLLAGEYPGTGNEEDTSRRLRALLECGITAFVDLTRENEYGLPPYEELLHEEAAKSGWTVQYNRMSIPDGRAGSVEHIERVLGVIEECLGAGRPVYVHCFGGHGRTGMVVGCYLVQSGYGGEEALDRVRLLHNETSAPSFPSPETEEQRKRVAGWAAKLSPGERIYGCLLGGAVGDALGYPIEFPGLSEIRARYGPAGIQDFSNHADGRISDDTQMTLFTAEGLIRAAVCRKEKGACDVPVIVHHAYLRWLFTQGERIIGRRVPGASFHREPDGWLARIRGLYEIRAPGITCMTALQSGKMGTVAKPLNNSKGCGGIMRMAPAGLVNASDPFELGCELAAITHGHPSGYLAAGFFAQLIHEINNQSDLREAIARSTSRLMERPRHEECLRAVGRALRLAGEGPPSPEQVERLGRGFVGEEALAISLYCALVANDFAGGVRLAVNHGGDSDSTGAITGNILGVVLGRRSIPRAWLEKLELRDVIEQVSQDLMQLSATPDVLNLEEYRERYPGW